MSTTRATAPPPTPRRTIDILNCVELEYSAGEFYIYDYNAGLLRVLGADGSETAQIDPGKRTVTGLAAGDGGVYVGLAAEDGERTLALCTEGGLSDERQLAFSVHRSGGEGCLLTDDEGLWRFSGDEPEPVAIWSECGITLADLTALVPLGEGYALINGGALYLLEPAEPGDIVPRREVSVYSLDPATDSMLDGVARAHKHGGAGLYAYTVHDAGGGRPGAAAHARGALCLRGGAGAGVLRRHEPGQRHRLGLVLRYLRAHRRRRGV